MTIQTPAIVIPHPRRGPGRRLIIGLAAATLAALVGAGLWQANRDSGTQTATPPPVAVDESTGARSVESTPTYYLVGSEAEAATVQAGINEANAIRAQLGEAPLPEVVTVATTADADAFLRMMGEQDAIRHGLGLPEVTVVDLRQPAASTPALDPAALSDQEMYSRWQAEASGQQQANGIAEEASR